MDPTRVLDGYTIFLDRDGTLNEDPGFLRSASDLKLLPGVATALARLKSAGARLVVVTNPASGEAFSPSGIWKPSMPGWRAYWNRVMLRSMRSIFAHTTPTTAVVAANQRPAWWIAPCPNCRRICGEPMWLAIMPMTSNWRRRRG